ncbi:MAG TPA: hypothetical protein VLV86_22920 [Vicinamibacterales bacterium]|nr:hypothetical protein [Vicinamibacterales bacterium]
MTFRAATTVIALLCCTPAFGQRTPQSPPVEFRPFALLTAERFSASTTFDALFGSTLQPFWGGGVDVTTRRNMFVDLVVSHMGAAGERAFLNDGQVFRLGIPLHATLTPIELTAGYRFRRLDRRRRPRRITPFLGGGVGWYLYRETSDFAAAGEDIDATHAGLVALGGAEFRVTKWIGIMGDVQYTYIPGIIGGNTASVAAVAGESDLGGIAARLRVVFGR